MSKSKFYTEKEMVEAIKAALEDMGCIIDQIDIENRIFKVDAPEGMDEEVILVMESIMSEYMSKRREVVDNNPFFGVYDILEDMDQVGGIV